MTTQSKPSWLAALNTPKIEPAADPSPAIDEHVESLPKYDAPPPLIIDSNYSELVKVDEALAHPVAASSTMLPFKFDAVAFEKSIASGLDLNVGIDDAGPGEEDGPWAEGWSKRAGIVTGTKEVKSTDVIKSGLNAMPFFPNEESLLDQPKLGRKDPEPEAKPWLNRLTVTEQVAYDNHVKAVMGVNPLHAAKLMRLKGFESRYVGVVTSAEMAENHLLICLNKGEDPGGWSDATHQHTVRAQAMLENELQKQSEQAQRARWQRYIIDCREEWKDAIVERANQKEILDQNVKAAHAKYTDAKALTFNEYIAMIEPEGEP